MNDLNSICVFCGARTAIAGYDEGEGAEWAIAFPEGVSVRESFVNLIPTPGGGMANWRERLFAAMSRNAGGVVEFFRLPSNAVVELGTRVQI